ncbi:MAG: molybdopterin-dependent oxidoreductase [Rhodovibrio sp.]|nr:molybdopterin-dependent oxidoreductase [Rhodovibrio sp.]
MKGGIVTWETQQTDYPRTRPGSAQPRAARLLPGRQLFLVHLQRQPPEVPDGAQAPCCELWREARKTQSPVAAWAVDRRGRRRRRRATSRGRGLGGFVRAEWDEVNEIIAAANAYTIKRYGPDRIVGFSPIPAMSMVSYAAGTRYLSLFGGTCMSFYDWYCDLPPASPQTWGEQTDVPESADWYNSSFLMIWGSNVPQTRTPDAHFYTEVRYKGAKSVVVSPDYSEASKFADLWLHAQAGHRRRARHGDRPRHPEGVPRRPAGRVLPATTSGSYTDMPMLVRLDAGDDGHVCRTGCCAPPTSTDALGQSEQADWKTVAIDETSGDLVAPRGSIGFRWGDQGKWNLEEKDADGQRRRAAAQR